MDKLRSSSLPLLLSLSLWTPYPHQTESFSFTTTASQKQRRPCSTRQYNAMHRYQYKQLHVLSQSPALLVEAEGTTTSFVGNDIGPELQQQNIQTLCIDDNDHGGILSSLFGSKETRDDFFEHTFGRSVAHFPRTTITDAGQTQVLDPPISGIDLPSLYETNEWTCLRKRGSRDMLNKNEMSYNGLSEYVAGGGSIIVPITPDDYLFPTKVQIEMAMGLQPETGTTMNIYHSGPSAVALNIHYDSYPVFVLQLEGEKEWIIQDDAFGLPHKEVTKWKNLTMTEGDLLYIPKGVFHAATTAEGWDTTTHATIGLL